MDMGVVGPRSMVAFCHTVPRENVLPAFSNQLFGHETKIASPIKDKTGEHRPATTYLQMLDKYGSDTDKKDKLAVLVRISGQKFT
jgi:hypothetical protein